MFSDCKQYEDDIRTIASINIDWDSFKGKSILITGATGLIGTFLIDLLMYRNNKFNNDIVIFAVSRSKEKVFLRFNDYLNSRFFIFIQKDIQYSFELNAPVDYIIHGASNTHPIAYASEPINTIMLSILGAKSIFDFASIHNTKRTLFLSTVEIYGENRGDVETFSEDYCGYIDCNTLRAGYPEGKRAAEALCQAYIKEKNIDILIARCCRVYGPTMGNDDSKVIAQFIKNAVNGEDIKLKSNGDQQFAYSYVADICSAILFLLLYGEKAQAYNIANTDIILSLKQIAEILSEYSGKKIIYDIPSSVESIGYSKVTKALLDCSKIKKLGWEAQYSLKNGLIRTVEILHHV